MESRVTVCFPVFRGVAIYTDPAAELCKGLKGLMDAMLKARAKYNIGQVVRHRRHPFRGVVFDVDPTFSNTEEWYQSIPEESRPAKDQPFYHLLAENDQSFYIAYVSEQNLIADYSGEPVEHPDVEDFFGAFDDGSYHLQVQLN